MPVPVPDNRPAAARMQQHFEAMHDDGDKADRRALIVALIGAAALFAIGVLIGIVAALVLL